MVLLVIFARVAEDIGENDDIFFAAQLGQLLFEKCRSSDVLQADGVEHSGGGFIETRRRIARHGLTRQAFHDKAAQLVEVDDIFELDAVAERATSGNDRDS